jgi:hypothetical protein
MELITNPISVSLNADSIPILDDSTVFDCFTRRYVAF